MDFNFKQAKEIKRLTTVFLFRYFRVLIAVLVLFLLFLGNNYVIKPKRVDIAKSQKDAIEDREEEKEKLLKYLEDLKKYRLEYEKIPLVSREKIKKFLPDEANKQGLFLEIENIFKDYDIAPGSISISEKEPAPAQSSRSKVAPQKASTGLSGDIGVLDISVDLGEGIDYEKMKEILAVIENNLRLMDFESMNFSNATGVMQLNIKTYYLKS